MRMQSYSFEIFFPLHFSMWLNHLFSLPPLTTSFPAANAADLCETLLIRSHCYGSPYLLCSQPTLTPFTVWHLPVKV